MLNEDIEQLVGKSINCIEFNAEKNIITLQFGNGEETYYLDVEGDCCSRSWIEHITIPEHVVGAVIMGIEDSGVVRSEDDPEGMRLLQVYETRFLTSRGYIVLEFRNESNGYYGGYLVLRKDRDAERGS